jgi:hypothetical protein
VGTGDNAGGVKGKRLLGANWWDAHSGEEEESAHG